MTGEFDKMNSASPSAVHIFQIIMLMMMTEAVEYLAY
jgi:hypothetical protein